MNADNANLKENEVEKRFVVCPCFLIRVCPRKSAATCFPFGGQGVLVVSHL
jgi:hypothetical protein